MIKVLVMIFLMLWWSGEVDGWICGSEGKCICTPHDEVFCAATGMTEAPRFSPKFRRGKDIILILDSADNFIINSLEQTLGFRSVSIKGGGQAFCNVVNKDYPWLTCEYREKIITTTCKGPGCRRSSTHVKAIMTEGEATLTYRTTSKTTTKMTTKTTNKEEWREEVTEREEMTEEEMKKKEQSNSGGEEELKGGDEESTKRTEQTTTTGETTNTEKETDNGWMPSMNFWLYFSIVTSVAAALFRAILYCIKLLLGLPRTIREWFNISFKDQVEYVLEEMGYYPHPPNPPHRRSAAPKREAQSLDPDNIIGKRTRSQRQ